MNRVSQFLFLGNWRTSNTCPSQKVPLISFRAQSGETREWRGPPAATAAATGISIALKNRPNNGPKLGAPKIGPRRGF